MFTYRILSRDFSREIRVVPDIMPTRYSFVVAGGPEEAALSLRGEFTDLIGFMNYLRCPIEIYDSTLTKVWWGFVYSVEVRWGSRTFNVSLGSMSNRISATYAKKVGSSRSKDVTAWAQNDSSVATYGTKEKKLNMSDSTLAQATAQRNLYLDFFKLPRQVAQTGQSQGESNSAYVVCKGWYYTLNWKYYVNVTDTEIDTGSQISAIVSSTGQFITAIDTITTGVSSNQLRDGNQRGGEYVNALMKSGTSDTRVLVSSIDSNRRFTLQKGPLSSDIAYFVDDRDTWKTPVGTEVPRSSCPVGKWYRITDLPSELNISDLSSPIDYFIGRSNYDVDSDKLTVEPYGAASPFEAVIVE